MTADLCWLETPRTEDRRLVGGKGKNLIRLAREGIRVPAGFVITTQGCQKVCESVRTTAETSRSRCIDVPIGGAVVGALRKLAGPYAVRSSSPLEDEEEHTCAGLFKTHLNVGDAEGVLSSVVECVTSAGTEYVQSYLRRRGVATTSAISMAVVVQSMVCSRVAGVVLSCDPVTRDVGSLLIEVAEGGCELLVSGAVVPCVVRLKKSLLASASGRRTSDTQLRTMSASCGRVLGDDAWSLLCEHLDELGNAVLLAEKLLRGPVEVEWGISDKLYVFQARRVASTRGS